MNRTTKPLLILSLVLLPTILTAQYHKPYQLTGSGKLHQSLEESKTLGTVLYLAAHPDDESTELMAYLANERDLRTAYLSLTRGDGGQNLLGPEKGAQLGILRTQELMGARSVDRGLQFFSRANDFGYSKTPKETLNIWDKEAVLSDVVWVIRKLQPDVLITRFPSEGYEGAHGHHTASARLAEQAFDAAADPERFREQLDQVDPWQPTRLLFHTSPYFYRGEDEAMDTSKVVTAQLGQLNAQLGSTYIELGAKSQTHHKSQGFGEAPSRGGRLAYLRHTKGAPASDDLMDGINTSWGRVSGGGVVSRQLDRAIDTYQADQPDKMVLHLIRAYNALDQVDNAHWRKVKSREIKHLILAANGCRLDARASRPYGVPGAEVSVTASLLKRGSHPMELEGITYPFQEDQLALNKTLKQYKRLDTTRQITIPADAAFTQPYWLREPMMSKGMYSVPKQELIGLPETPTAFRVTFQIRAGDARFDITKPVRYQREDRVKGEVYESFEIGPPATFELASDILAFPDNNTKRLNLTVKSHQPELSGKVMLKLPEGFQTASEKAKTIKLTSKGATKDLTFKIDPPQQSAQGNLTAQFTNEKGTFTRETATINYDHIPKQTLFPEAKAKLLRLNIETKGQRVGYIMGSGDEIPKALRQLGYTVTMLNESNIEETDLQQFDAVVTGVRAYNTQEWLPRYQDKLMGYVQQGGTMVSQYNKDRNMVTDELGPYPFTIAYDRVTQETAAVNFLKPGHPVLNEPNDIGKSDFKGWVQERGLYFPGQWSDAYTPLLSSRDANESPKKGGLLVADYGEGQYIYTGYAFFRQLPAGVPGAYRLFTNLLAYDG
jgi:LmbE family N-acetylglucosaminyl deacetylase